MTADRLRHILDLFAPVLLWLRTDLEKELWHELRVLMHAHHTLQVAHRKSAAETAAYQSINKDLEAALHECQHRG